MDYYVVYIYTYISFKICRNNSYLKYVIFLKKNSRIFLLFMLGIYFYYFFDVG